MAIAFNGYFMLHMSMGSLLHLTHGAWCRFATSGSSRGEPTLPTSSGATIVSGDSEPSFGDRVELQGSEAASRSLSGLRGSGWPPSKLSRPCQRLKPVLGSRSGLDMAKAKREKGVDQSWLWRACSSGPGALTGTVCGSRAASPGHVRSSLTSV